MKGRVVLLRMLHVSAFYSICLQSPPFICNSTPVVVHSISFEEYLQELMQIGRLACKSKSETLVNLIAECQKVKC